MTKPVRISYWFIAATFLLVGLLHLGTPMLAALFSFFILHKLHFVRSKWLAIGIFALLLILGRWARGFTRRRSWRCLP